MDDLQWGTLRLLGGIVVITAVPLLIYRFLTPDCCHEDTDLALWTVFFFCLGVFAIVSL